MQEAPKQHQSVPARFCSSHLDSPNPKHIAAHCEDLAISCQMLQWMLRLWTKTSVYCWLLICCFVFRGPCCAGMVYLPWSSLHNAIISQMSILEKQAARSHQNIGNPQGCLCTCTVCCEAQIQIVNICKYCKAWRVLLLLLRSVLYTKQHALAIASLVDTSIFRGFTMLLINLTWLCGYAYDYYFRQFYSSTLLLILLHPAASSTVSRFFVFRFPQLM